MIDLKGQHTKVPKGEKYANGEDQNKACTDKERNGTTPKDGSHENHNYGERVASNAAAVVNGEVMASRGDTLTSEVALVPHQGATLRFASTTNDWWAPH